ncbi:MAG: hypothetical protein GON13_01340 [Nanoarchaeota archaeon]|nr:hypothetical protein [Nanoarchaeota archaeon]
MGKKNSLLLILFVLPASVLAANDWWNDTWQYRLPINISSGNYVRENMPVELLINFTNLLDQLNDSQNFDENSIRIIENRVEIPSQFDDVGIVGDGYGELIWVINGTTDVNTNRTYNIYFDTEANTKISPSYSLTWGSITPGNNIIENSKLKIALGNADAYTGIIDFVIKSEENQDQSKNNIVSNSRIEGLYVNDDNTHASLAWSSELVKNGAVRKIMRVTGTDATYTVYENISIYYLSGFIKIQYSSPNAANYRILGLGTPGGDASSETDDSTTTGSSNGYDYRGVHDDANNNGYGIVLNQNDVSGSWSIFDGSDRYGWNVTTNTPNFISYYFMIINGATDVTAIGQSLSNPLIVYQTTPESKIECFSNNDCDDSDYCTTDTCTNPGNDTANCTFTQTNYCVDDDALCCSLCNFNLDNDCTASCGNGVCEAPGENSYICPADCTAVCGNDVCESSENQCICPADCGVCESNCGTCLSFQCIDYSCSCAITANCCPNNICEAPGENSTSCPDDCLGLQIIVYEPDNNTICSVNDNLTFKILVNKDNEPVSDADVKFLPGFSSTEYSLTENTSTGYYYGSILTPTGFLGEYSLLISAEQNGSIGRKNLVFNISKKLNIELLTDEISYEIGDNIIIFGTLTTLQGIPRANYVVNFILNSETSNWQVSNTNKTNAEGSFVFVYETTFADPFGKWNIQVNAQDLAGNNISQTIEREISLPSKFSYFDIKFNSPIRGSIFTRGQEIMISIEVLKEDEIVSGANVTAITSEGVKIQLLEKQTGIYEGIYEVPSDASLGDFNLMVEVRKELFGALKGGGEFTTLGVLPLTITPKLLKPVQTTFIQGETILFVIAANYPDGSNVNFANATIKSPNNDLIYLYETEEGTYEGAYTILFNNSGTWGALITIIDPDGNTGTVLTTLFIEKAGFTLSPLQILIIMILFGGTLFVFYKVIGSKLINKSLLKHWNSKESHLNEMLNATQKKYFERKIDEETYMNLMRKYEGNLVGIQSRIKDLKEKLGTKKGKSKKERRQIRRVE